MHASAALAVDMLSDVQYNHSGAALAASVRRFRKQARLSQSGLALKAGLSRSTIAAVELNKYGQPDLSTITRLAAALGVQIEALTGPVVHADTSVVEAFLASPLASAHGITDEEVAWLRSAPAVFWSGLGATVEHVAQILLVRRMNRGRS